MKPVFFDDVDEPGDLNAQLRRQYPGRHVDSLPLFTTVVPGDVALTAIRVMVDGRVRHQLYAVDRGTWSLTGIYILYTDALRELLRWRRYIVEDGGTVAEWQLTHQDGIYPEGSSFAS
jgi:hypothetical protein